MCSLCSPELGCSLTPLFFVLFQVNMTALCKLTHFDMSACLMVRNSYWCFIQLSFLYGQWIRIWLVDTTQSFKTQIFPAFFPVSCIESKILLASENNPKLFLVYFEVRGQQGMDFFPGRSVIMDFVHLQWFNVKDLETLFWKFVFHLTHHLNSKLIWERLNKKDMISVVNSAIYYNQLV